METSVGNPVDNCGSTLLSPFAPTASHRESTGVRCRIRALSWGHVGFSTFPQAISTTVLETSITRID